MPENRGEKLPVSLINQLKEKLDINIDRSDRKTCSTKTDID